MPEKRKNKGKYMLKLPFNFIYTSYYLSFLDLFSKSADKNIGFCIFDFFVFDIKFSLTEKDEKICPFNGQ
jgi:hypothetical protein